MKLSAPVSSIFLLQPCRAYRHDLDETGLLIPGCWFEPTPAMDQRVPDNLENPAQNPLPEESGGRAKQRRRPVKTSSHHWTGDIGGAGRQPKPNAQPRPCPVGLNQHVLRLRHLAMSVLAGTTKQSRSPPRRGQRASAARHPGRRQIILAPRARAQGIPVRPRFRMNPAREFFSSG